ncbi:lytic transglycosylase domain-containing protein [Actinomadura parmotrematis]|uniref:Lytic transglycosylase domain-containing protein n=1 Tax=Actinomadura parmotrematis TaxID=2864039 RepID=A0ABS7FPN5_9ACTN|nr:lytic transglycosylase domain-containing protein [Actinomadura parmotrematis]MBW8481523.1 lytic transglycosylase domain-containing protein [Actinomadura parmotrematis]
MIRIVSLGAATALVVVPMADDPFAPAPDRADRLAAVAYAERLHGDRAAGDRPARNKDLARALMRGHGWRSERQFRCLERLWSRESHWNESAHNPAGAHGIPQALPGSKMASAGPDWRSSARTQIKWGLRYVAARYGTPCSAWNHWQAAGWY